MNSRTIQEDAATKRHELPGKKNARKYMRYKEAAAYYGLGTTKMRQLAKEARATLRIDGIVLVNLSKFERFLEDFAEE